MGLLIRYYLTVSHRGTDTQRHGEKFVTGDE